MDALITANPTIKPALRWAGHKQKQRPKDCAYFPHNHSLYSEFRRTSLYLAGQSNIEVEQWLLILPDKKMCILESRDP